MMHRAVSFLVVLCLGSTAWAEVSVEYTAAGGTSVDVVLRAGQAGQVLIPAGTIIATGEEEQRFLIGQTIERSLGAGEEARVTVSAFCLDLGLPAPGAGSVMRPIGEARGDLARLLAVATGADHMTAQDAFWALGTADHAPSEAAAALLARAGLVPKSRAAAPRE